MSTRPRKISYEVSIRYGKTPIRLGKSGMNAIKYQARTDGFSRKGTRRLVSGGGKYGATEKNSKPLCDGEAGRLRDCLFRQFL